MGSTSLTCTCGVESEFSMQTNMVRPRVDKCRCGNVLHYEIAENPVLGRARPGKAGEATLSRWSTEITPPQAPATSPNESPTGQGLILTIVHGTWGRGL